MVRRSIQENIMQKKQTERAKEQFRYWLNRMESKNDIGYKMANAWGAALSSELYYDIELIDYNLYSNGCSKADRIVYDAYYKF